MKRILFSVGFSGFLAAALLAGCSSSGKVMSDARSEPTLRDSAAQVAHDTAVQHFVDGSMYEMKGEYAQAVLEYQDALRYDLTMQSTSRCQSVMHNSGSTPLQSKTGNTQSASRPTKSSTGVISQMHTSVHTSWTQRPKNTRR